LAWLAQTSLLLELLISMTLIDRLLLIGIYEKHIGKHPLESIPNLPLKKRMKTPFCVDDP